MMSLDENNRQEIEKRIYSLYFLSQRLEVAEVVVEGQEVQRVSGLRCTSLLRASPQQLFSLALCHFLVNGHFASTLPYLINALKKRERSELQD